MTPNGLPIISRWHEQGIGFLPSVDIYGWDKQGSAEGAKKRTICKMSHQHSTALPDIRRHTFSSVKQIQMFRNEQNAPFAKKPDQAEQPEMRISLFNIKQLWNEIAKGLAEDFLWLCASWIQSQTCYCGRSNLKAGKEEDFSKLIMAKISSRRLKLESPKKLVFIPDARTQEQF